MHKELGWDIDRAADPNKAKGYSIHYGVMPSNNSEEKEEKWWTAIAQGLAVHQSVGSEHQFVHQVLL